MDYVITHLHTMISNSILADSPTSLKDYLKEIKKKDGIKGLIVTEHGNCMGWYKKYQILKEVGLKYIHAVEAYTCLNGDDKFNRHILLYALNYEGLEEMNELVSLSYQRDGHFYKRPRVYIDEILSCKNIIISTSCSAGIFTQPKEEDKENSELVKNKVLDWGLKNKDKLFLEIQPHTYEKQQAVNAEVIELVEKFNFQIICSNDVHYANKEMKKVRETIAQDKNAGHEFEHQFDLSIKSYQEQLEGFLKLDIDEELIKTALENTVKLYEMCSEYEIDTSFKYPQIYENPKQILMEKSINRLFELDYISPENYQVYFDRINMELDGMEKLDSLGYINLFSDWMSWCKEQEIGIGYSRGSSSGSIVAYLSKITNIDSIMWGMSWDRFMNTKRVTLSDIDLDIQPSRRTDAKSWFFNHPKLNASDILAFSTVAYKGACDTIIRTSELTRQQGEKLKEMYGDIRTKHDIDDGKSFRDKMPITIEELKEQMGEFKDYIEQIILLEGCILSVGSHPAGVLVSDLNLRKKIGIITMDDKDSDGFKEVSQCDMKELEAMGYVKADALGLSTVGVLSRVSEYLGQEFPNPQKINFNIPEVWEDIKKSPVGIFQFEETKTHEYMKTAIELVPLEKKLYTMSMMSGLIRPSGKSTRESFLNGETGNNGHPDVDKAFPNTSGFVVYQEDLLEFLAKFCGYDYAQADIIRRSVAKKMPEEKFRPMMSDIERDFRNYFPQHYDCTEEQIQAVMKSFLDIVYNSRLYAFSLNHALPYTMYGYIQAQYRYYYPLEYMVANLNEFNGKPDKMKDIYYFINNFTDIKIIKPIYPICKLEYTYNKDKNIIYEGMLGAKDVGKNVEDGFNSINHSAKFSNMVEFIKYIKDNDIKGIGKTELIALNKMKFFREFGTQKMNEYTILAMLGDKEVSVSKYKYDPKQKEATRKKKMEDLQELLNNIPDEDYNMLQQATYDLDIFGHTDIRLPIEEIYYVIDCTKPYSKYIIDLYNMNTGEIVTYKGKNIPKPKKNTVIVIQNRELKPDYFVSGEHSDGKPKSTPTGLKSWNITQYYELNPKTGSVMNESKE